MELNIVKTKKQYFEYLDWVDGMFEKVKPGSADGNKLQVALLLIKQYEDINSEFPIPELARLFHKS